MGTTKYSGTVVDQSTGGPIGDLRVEAWDDEGISPDLIACAFGDDDGRFTVEVDSGLLAALLPGQNPDLYFKVFRGAVLVATTRGGRTWSPLEGDDVGRILIDPNRPTLGPDQPSAFTVRGMLLDEDGSPVAKGVVTAFDKRLRSMPELGHATTGDRGDFLIHYDAAAFRSSGRSAANIVVRGVDAHGAAVAESALVANAPATLLLDLVRGGAASPAPAELDALRSAIAPQLDGAKVSDLADADVALLAESAVVPWPKIAALVAAERAARAAGVAVEPLYALARAGLILVGDGLIAEPPAHIRGVLSAALQNRWIRGGSQALDAVATDARKATTALALAPAAAGEAATIGDIARTVLTDLASSSAFVDAVAGRSGSLESFWDKDVPPSLSKDAISKLRLAFGLASFTDRNVSLITALQRGSSTAPPSIALAPAVAAPAPSANVAAFRADVATQTAAVATTAPPPRAPVGALTDLAKLDEASWVRLLDEAHVTPPANLPGKDDVARKQAYAAKLTENVRLAFPTAVFAAKMAADAQPADAETTQFFAKNDFAFEKDRLTPYLLSHPSALDGAKDPKALVDNLLGIERLFKIAPHYEDMKALRSAGLTSSYAVNDLGEEDFESLLGASLGKDKAKSIFGRACFTVDGAKAQYAAYGASSNSVPSYALPKMVFDSASSPSALHTTAAEIPVGGATLVNYAALPSGVSKDLAPGIADWPALFGTLSFCSCDRCASVHGPNAYLFDLLRFLGRHRTGLLRSDDQGKKTYYSALDMLIGDSRDGQGFARIGRRCDIGHIDFTCNNSDTAVPYVDLLNEVLEWKVAAIIPEQVPLAHHIDTVGTADDLAVERTVIPDERKAYDAAYSALAGSSYPWSLPFDRAAAEARATLSALGVDSATLIRTFRPASATPPLDPADHETLGLLPSEVTLVTAVSRIPWVYWGQPQAGWPTPLLNVGTFLTASGLTYDELRELLDSQFLTPFLASPTQTPYLTGALGDPTCDLSKLSIGGFAPTSVSTLLEFVHRFLRLRNKLGFTISDLDKALAAIPPTPGLAQPGIDEPQVLRALSILVRLQKTLGLSTLELLTFWATIDHRASAITSIPSLFQTTFLDPKLDAISDDAAAFNALLAGGPLADTVTVGMHAPRIRAALGMSAFDFALFTDDATSMQALGQNSVFGNPKLTLTPLTQLFQVSALARGLGWSIADVLALKVLSGINPFDSTNLSNALTFVETAKKLQAAGVSISDLSYVLALAPAPTSAVRPADASVIDALATLSAGVAKIVGDTTFVVGTMLNGAPIAIDPNGVLTKKALASALSGDALTNAIALLEGTLDGTLVDGVLATMPFLDPTLAKAELGVGGVTGDDRYGWVLPQLDLWLRATESTTFVERTLATSFELDLTSVTSMLEQWLPSPSNSSASGSARAISDFLPAATPDGTPAAPTPAPTAADPRWQTYLRVVRIAWLAHTFGMTSTELAAVEPAWFDMSQLPLASIAAAPLFSSFLRLVDTFALRNRLTAPDALFTLFAAAGATGATAVTVASMAAQIFGWSKTDLDAFSTPFALTLPGDFKDEKALVFIAAAFDVLGQLGASATQAFDWVKQFNDLTATAVFPSSTAHEIDNAARASRPPGTWADFAHPISDRLRDAQREALVAYILANGKATSGTKYATNADLYADLLIDVDMTSCQTSSRVLSAISSTQLFIQRIFLGLEPDVAFGQTAADQWEWMGNFTIWEANRKVFLYPENWIIPELRDDKTELFNALETSLAQQPVIEQTAEDALIAYATGLNELAQLDIMGSYFEQAGTGDSADDVLHVIARTRRAPETVYYRTQTGGATWSGWQVVDCDVASAYVLPVVHEGRLLLFWPIATIKTNETQDTRVPTGKGSPPKKHLEVQLAWSEYRAGKWTSKVVTSNTVSRAGDASNSTLDQLLVYTTQDQGVLKVHCALPPANQTSADFTVDPQALVLLSYVAQVFAVGVWKTAMDTLSLVAASELYGFGLLDTKPDDGSLKSLPITTGTGTLSFYLKDPTNTALVVGPAILTRTRLPFTLKPEQQDALTVAPFQTFYHDDEATFLITTVAPNTVHETLFGAPLKSSTRFFRLAPHYHPYARDFVRRLLKDGFKGPRRWTVSVHDLQAKSNTIFNTQSSPYESAWPAVAPPYPIEDVDFSWSGAYSIYNWELFFHAPLLIAGQLSQNRQFSDAHAWYQMIFDPTGTSGGSIPARFWKVRPFWENTDLSSIATQIADPSAWSQPSKDSLTQSLNAQIKAWRNDPFNPHLIARMRPIAYMKTTVMKMIDNLIAWGDDQFTQNTLESINEATQLYVLASNILGPRPTVVPEVAAPTPMNYWELRDKKGTFSDPIVSVEAIVPTPPAAPDAGTGATPELDGLYFCIPANDQLMAYWDTIDNRLFKIRHCMNIQGVVEQLPLFQPPINPLLLVEAEALGMSLDSVLESVNSAPPLYRFRVLVAKAMELAGSAAQLGGALLSALEKRDAEGLALLRGTNEVDLLKSMRLVKARAVDDAQSNLDALSETLAMAQAKSTYYRTRVYMNAGEAMGMMLSIEATTFQTASAIATALASGSADTPDMYGGGVGPLPAALAAFGGTQISSSAKYGADELSITTAIMREAATQSLTQASYGRRMDEWTFQGGLADLEIQQVKQQIVGAKIKLDMAQKELAAQDLQIDQATKVNAYMRSKFTSQDLYSWMAAQLSTVYYQAYQKAFDLAKSAERAFQFELAVPTAQYISSGNWDNNRQGLLAADRLSFDIRRLDAAYLEENVREYEITKHVSLAEWFPQNLFELITTGTTTISVPEALFELDYPGHYLRRLRTVSLSIPGVSGPFTGVACTLTLLKNTIRMSPATPGGKANMVDNFAAMQRIVTSTGQNDTGLFEASLHDDRFLPFEGAGVISTFRIDLPSATNAFDLEEITDVVLSLRYTARDGGSSATNGSPALPRVLLYRAAIEDPEAWFAFQNPTQGLPVLSLDLSDDNFSFVPGAGSISIQSVDFAAQWTSTTASMGIEMVPPGATAGTKAGLSATPSEVKSQQQPPITGKTGTWTMQVTSLPTDSSLVLTNGQLNPAAFTDIWFFVGYAKSGK